MTSVTSDFNVLACVELLAIESILHLREFANSCEKMSLPLFKYACSLGFGERTGDETVSSVPDEGIYRVF